MWHDGHHHLVLLISISKAMWWSHPHRLYTLISIVASWSSRQLLLLRLSLPLSDKVKQIHGDCISYNKETTIRLLTVTNNFYKTWSSHTKIFISHHVLTISHHNMPSKNKLDVLYFVCCKFYMAAMGLARTNLTYASKTTTTVCQVGVILTFSRTGCSHTWFN